MIKYNVMLYPYKHESKIQAQKFVGAIKNGILKHPQELTVAQIAKVVTNGHTVILGHAEYSTAEITLMQESQKGIGAGIRHWKNQQVFAIDFDNEKKIENETVKLTGNKYISIDKALAHCGAVKVPPAILYTTSSHKEDHHKFRLVFILDQVIDTLERHRDVMNSLFNIFLVDNECVVDSKCCDPCRLFYPGKTIIYKNYGAVVNTDTLIERYNDIANTARRVGTHYKRAAVNREKIQFNAPEMIDLIKANDVENILPIIVNKLCTSRTRVFTGIDSSGLKGEQESYIYTKYIVYKLLTVDSCFHQSPRTSKPVTVRLPEDYYMITRKFPLHLLLGLPLNDNFSCILPTHADSKPSARIEINKDGDYVYHCYGCDSYLDIFNILERITGWSHLQAKAFINKLLHIRFETEWQIEKKQEITEYQDFIWSDQFKLKYKWLQKRLAHANVLGILNLVLQMARLYIYDRKITSNEKPLFYMSLSLMAKKAKDFGQKNMSKTVIHKKLKLLTRLGLIEIVKEDNLPAKFRHELLIRKFENQQYYRINCFAIPEFTMKLLDNAEAKLRELEQGGMRRKYYCREAELRANGAESANEQYVQDESKTRSAKVEDFYIKYKDTADKLIAKGWTTEKEILAKLKGYTTKRKQELSGICLPQLLNEMNLIRVAYSKQYESKFAIKKGLLCYGVNKLIVQESGW
jgi:hypothetical protein